MGTGKWFGYLEFDQAYQNQNAKMPVSSAKVWKQYTFLHRTWVNK